MTPFWSFGSRHRAPEPEVVAPPALEFRSRALSYLLETRPADGPWRILDLGAANHDNLVFFTSLGATYTVEGLFDTVNPCRPTGYVDVLCMRRIPDLLRFSTGTHFDLVLAWDLLNYLDEEALALVAERLAPHGEPGTKVYGLLSMDPKVPTQPGRAVVVDDKTIRLDGWQESRVLKAPGHTPAHLDEALAPFAIDKTYLLKHRMHEYVFEHS